MPRQGRLHVPGGLYHVIGRGLERRNIFSTDVDKIDFLARLGIGLQETACQCLAFAVMSNHYHLLIQVRHDPLSHLMSKLLSGYATAYNRRRNRSGYVFQNRFKSILCDADQYLLQLICYIHLNPLKARMLDSVEHLERYRWTGHAGLMGHHIQPWHDRDAVLRLFSSQRRYAIRQYRQFILAGLDEMNAPDLSGGGLVRSYGGWDSISMLKKEHEVRIGDERILGDSDFVASVLQDDRLEMTACSKWQAQGRDVRWLVMAVCRYF